MYNFDKEVERYNTNSAKWDEAAMEYGKDIDYYGVADMDFETAIPIKKAIKDVSNRDVFGYTIVSDEYYEAVQSWMKSRLNWNIEKDWILFAPRIGITISIIINEFSNIGDEVIVQTPGYAPLKDFVIKNERKVLENELKLKENKYFIDFEDLENRVSDNTKIFILCSPHNPVGRVWTKEELEEIGDFCIKHDLLLVSDEVHCDLIFKDSKHYPISSINKELASRSIVCNSVSKTFNVPGIMAANIIIENEEIRNKLSKAFDKMGLHNPNVFAEEVVKASYNHSGDWLDEVNIYIEENYRLLKRYIEKNIPELKVIDSEGTYLAWIDISKLGLGKKDIIDLFIKKSKIGIYLGDDFGKGGNGFIRFNLATQRNRILNSLSQLKKEIDNLRGR